MDEDGFDAASKAKKMRPDEDSVKAKKQLTVKFGFGKKKKGATGKDPGLDASTMFQIAAAKDPAEGGSGEQAKAGKGGINELLELEMRARAIKALLNKKPEEGEGDDGAEGERGDDEAAEEEEEDDGAAEQKKAMEEQKRLQKAREALMVSEAKRREEDEIREKKQEEIRQRIEAEVKRKCL